jgi:hypothetical protein
MKNRIEEEEREDEREEGEEFIKLIIIIIFFVLLLLPSFPSLLVEMELNTKQLLHLSRRFSFLIEDIFHHSRQRNG